VKNNRTAPRWLPPNERAYAGGWFEGEGWVTLAPRRRADGSNAYVLLAGATNTATEPLDFVSTRWGGSRGCYQQPGHRPLYTWRLQGRMASDFLRDVEAFLLSERLRAKVEVGIRFQLGREDRSGSDRTRRAEEEVLAVAMKQLNRRGAASLRNEDCYRLVDELNGRLLERTRPRGRAAHSSRPGHQ
jgi:hypothetical protein